VPACISARRGSPAALQQRAPSPRRSATGMRVRAHRPAARAGRARVKSGHGGGPIDRRHAGAGGSRDASVQPGAAGRGAPAARGRPPAVRRPAAPRRGPPRPRPQLPPGTPARHAQRPRPQRLGPAAGTRSPGARCASDGDNCRDALARGCRRRAAQQRHCALHPHAWPRAGTAARRVQQEHPPAPAFGASMQRAAWPVVLRSCISCCFQQQACSPSRACVHCCSAHASIELCQVHCMPARQAGSCRRRACCASAEGRAPPCHARAAEPGRRWATRRARPPPGAQATPDSAHAAVVRHALHLSGARQKSQGRV
jgi:hypothetical protein